MRVLVATDAWHPQVNGVVRTLTSLARTAILFAPPDFSLCERVREGATIRMGEPLMRMR
jgi:hypothetical protein